MPRLPLFQPPQSLWARESILAGVLIALAAVLAPIAHSLGGRAGLGAEWLGLGVCLPAFAIALAVSHWSRDSGQPLAGLLLAMGFRTGVPLLLLMLLHLRGGLDSDGLLYYALTFYFVALALETWLSLPRSVPSSAKIV